MKSELRHKLQRNALADWLVETGQSLKPYQNLLVILAVGVVAVIVAYSWYSHASAEQTAQSWNQLNAGFNKAESLAKVAEEYHDTPAGQMAAVLAADTYLVDGCELLFQNKPKGARRAEEGDPFVREPRIEASPLADVAGTGPFRAGAGQRVQRRFEGRFPAV